MLRRRLDVVRLLLCLPLQFPLLVLLGKEEMFYGAYLIVEQQVVLSDPWKPLIDAMQSIPGIKE